MFVEHSFCITFDFVIDYDHFLARINPFMFKLVPILANNPSLTVLLSNYPEPRKYNCLDFVLYDDDHHVDNGNSKRSRRVIHNLFKLSEESFSEYDGNLSYPSLINLQLASKYHVTIAYLEPNRIYFMDYNSESEDENYVTRLHTVDDINHLLNIISKKLSSEYDWITEFLNTGQVLNYDNVKITIAKIESCYSKEELFKLIDETVNVIVEFIKIFDKDDHDLDFHIAYPMLRDLMHYVTSPNDDEFFITLSRHLPKEKANELKSKIEKEYRWM